MKCWVAGVGAADVAGRAGSVARICVTTCRFRSKRLRRASPARSLWRGTNIARLAKARGKTGHGHDDLPHLRRARADGLLAGIFFHYTDMPGLPGSGADDQGCLHKLPRAGARRTRANVGSGGSGGRGLRYALADDGAGRAGNQRRSERRSLHFSGSEGAHLFRAARRRILICDDSD